MKPIAATIAATDPTNGAGAGADLRTFEQFGVHGAMVVTAVTVQDTHRVYQLSPMRGVLVRRQWETLFPDLPVRAAKVGALATADVVKGLTDAFAQFPPPNLVLDPVILSSSGHRLLDDEGVGLLRSHLLPLSTLLTANWPELSHLSGVRVSGRPDLPKASKKLLELGCNAVLAKGGHSDDPDSSTDILFFPEGKPIEFRAQRVLGASPHGTGCALAAAIAARLAIGDSLVAAVEAAKEHTRLRIEGAQPLGRGKPILP